VRNNGDIMASENKSAVLNAMRIMLLAIVYLILLTLAILAIVQVGRASYQMSYQIFGDVVVEEPPGQNITFKIEENESVWNVAERLENETLIVNKYTFYVRLMVESNQDLTLESGDYILNNSMTYSEILGRIVK
jgi:UPF0755 protein